MRYGVPVCRLVGAADGGGARAGAALPPAVAAAAPAFADLSDAQAFVRDAIATRVERCAAAASAAPERVQRSGSCLLLPGP